MITVFHAIQSLVPGAEVSVGLYDQSITWHQPATAPVTPEQIHQEQQRLQQAYDWHEYQRNRAREYPSVQEQLDALYHAGVFPPAMAARIRAVKEKYPAPAIGQEAWARLHTVETTPQTMSVEEWLAQEQQPKITREEWLAQQVQAPRKLTREEWLAEQANIEN
jgi:hypothetical protein